MQLFSVFASSVPCSSTNWTGYEPVNGHPHLAVTEPQAIAEHSCN